MRFSFSDFELDPASYRLLRRDGEEIRMEPRVLELLACLVAHRDRVVAKEELIERLWSGQFVSDAVLTRAVYEARRAVGDDSRRQEFIKTVHGRGYRFVAAVMEVAPGDAIRAPEEPRAAVAAAALAPGAPGEEVPKAEGVGAPARRRRPWIAAVAAILLGGVVTALILARRESTREEALGRAKEGQAPPLRAAVLPLAASGGGADLELAALSITDLLTMRLDTLPGLLVRSPDYSRELASEAGSVAEFAARAEVNFVVSGSVRRLAGAPLVHVAVELHQLEAGGALSSVPVGAYQVPLLAEDQGIAEFVRVREAVVGRLVELVAPALAPPGEGPAPRDLEAYRLYLVARERLKSYSCGTGSAVTELIERSLERDPGFAIAWVLKAAALYGETWACGRDVSFAHQALEALERALALDPKLADAIYLKTLLLVELGRAEEAYAMVRVAHREQPDEARLLYAMGYALRYAGHLPQAKRCLDRAVAFDPLFLAEYGEAPLSYLYGGDVDEFLRLLPAGETPYHRFFRGFGLMRAGASAAARTELEPAFRLAPADLFGRAAAALAAILAGDRETGANIVRGIVRQREELGTPDGEMSYKEAQLLALAGEPGAALERLGRAVEQGFFCAPCFSADPILEPLRDDARYREILAQAERRHHDFGARFQFRGYTANPMHPAPPPSPGS